MKGIDITLFLNFVAIIAYNDDRQDTQFIVSDNVFSWLYFKFSAIKLFKKYCKAASLYVACAYQSDQINADASCLSDESTWRDEWDV